MPLLQYFGYVGPALLILLMGVNWLLPVPVVEPTHSAIARPAIRISSIETLPERVVFDTSLPQIAILPAPPQSAFSFVQITPGPVPALSLAEVAPKTPIIAKRYPAIKVVTHRAPPPVQAAASKSYNVRYAQLTAKPRIGTTLLSDIAGRFGKIFKVN
jgi:hypothetical protein